MTPATHRSTNGDHAAAPHTPEPALAASQRSGHRDRASATASARRRAPRTITAVVGLLLAGLVATGCGSDDSEPEPSRATSATGAASTTEKEAKAPKSGSAKRSFDRYFEEFRNTSFGLNVNGIRENDGGWIDVLWAGESIEDVDFDLVQRMCGTISGWLVSTDEKWANTGYIELLDGTRLAKCTVGNQDLEN